MTKTIMSTTDAKNALVRSLKKENKEWEKIKKFFPIDPEAHTRGATTEPEYDANAFLGLMEFINESYDLVEHPDVIGFLYSEDDPELPVYPCPLFSDEKTHPELWKRYYHDATFYHKNRYARLKKFVDTVLKALEGPLS